jgi:serine/threonine protein kinase
MVENEKYVQLFLEKYDTFSIGNYHVNKKKIGMGSFASIFHGIEKHLSIEVAIKRIHVKDVHKISPTISKEINIMKELKHPNIIKMYEVIYETDFDNINIIMEYAPMGSLHDYLKKNKNISEITSKYFMRQIAGGLKYLLSKNIMHRDLKPHNILMFENNILKIADFGLAKNFQANNQEFNTLCGSPLYMAPEIVIPMANKVKKSERSYTVKADLWSVGLILLEMIIGRFPIKAQSLYHLPEKLKEFEVVIPSNIIISNECNELINRLLIKDPVTRIDWNEFFNHQWFEIDEIKEQEKKKIQKENQLMEMAEEQIQSSPYRNSPLRKNSPLSNKNKLERLNFDLSTTRHNTSLSSSIPRMELSQLHNSFQELKKSCSKNNNKEKELENDNTEELFLSCEEKEIKEFKESQENDMNDKLKLEKKLDLILDQLQELKSIHNNNNSSMSPILIRKSEKNRNRQRQISETQFDMELSIENNTATTDNNMNEDMNVENESFEEINKEKYEFIVSNPINIKENKKNSIEQSHSGTPIQDSLKYYIHNSINIIKESANYISGNFKSI